MQTFTLSSALLASSQDENVLSATSSSCKRLHDVKTETSIYTLEGKPAGSIDYGGHRDLPATSSGRTMDANGFYDLPIVHYVPPTIYRIDTVTGLAARSLRSGQGAVRFQPVPAKAGVLHVEGRHQDPHVHRRQKGPEQDGTVRLLITGYGGIPLSENARLESRICLVA